MTAALTKIRFRCDDNMALPGEVESMWATEAGPGTYRIDNIPFYVRGLAFEDLVSAEAEPDGSLWFSGLARGSGNSTARLLFARERDVQTTRDELRALGCASELSDLPRLVAVNIPKDVPYTTIRKLFEAGEASGLYEFEEGCLGQK